MTLMSFFQVSAGSAVATRADQYYDDNNFTRSTKFVWEFPTPPPDRFMTRLVNMPLHLFNTLNAEHVNTILYSRRCRYSQPYRVNPNNTRNRRYRMFSRVTSDIAWILWDSWGARNRFQVVSPFCGGEETWEANEETKETPSCPAASPWLEMTAPTDAVLPPAFPAAVLTPSDVVMTTLPSLRKFSARVEKKASFPIAAAWPEMAAPSDAALFPAFPPTKLTERDTSSCPVASVSLEVAAPTDFALSPAFPAVVLTHFEAVVATLPSLSNSSPTVETDKSCRMEQRDALMLGIVVGTVGLYFKAGYYPQVRLLVINNLVLVPGSLFGSSRKPGTRKKDKKGKKTIEPGNVADIGKFGTSRNSFFRKNYSKHQGEGGSGNYEDESP